MFVPKESYLVDKQGLVDKIQETNAKLKGMNKLQDLELEVKRLQSQVKQTGNSLTEHAQLESTRFSELEQNHQNLAAPTGTGGTQGTLHIDMHKLCRLEAEVKRNEQSSQDNQQ